MSGITSYKSIGTKGDNNHYLNAFWVAAGGQYVKLGSNIHLVDSIISASEQGKVTIDDWVFCGHGVQILARGHDYNRFGRERQLSHTGQDIHIGEGTWLASGCIILGGSNIGKHAVITPGSVVAGHVPDYGFMVGNPAKLIKTIPHSGKRTSWK